MTRFHARSLTLALLLTSAVPVLAQGQVTPDPNGSAADTPAPASGGIDTLLPADEAPAVAAPAPTGDPVLDRLNALQAKVEALEARNHALEEKLENSDSRIQRVEVRAAKAVQPNVSPTLSDVAGKTTFKARGVIDGDYVAFDERRGGYDFNNGTGFRRARLGVEGVAFGDFNWRLEVDFAGNAVAVQDAYLQYAGIKSTLLTVGQFKAPFGLESNNSDNYNVFLERGMFNNAAATFGAERRIGASAQYVRDTFTVAAGLFGENESVFRAANAATVAGNAANPAIAAVTDINTPDEGWGGNARVTWEPIFDTGKILHLGAAAYYRTAVRSATAGNAARLNDRPNIRVDGGNIVDTGVITGVDSARYVGVEAAGILGPLTVAGEYGRLRLDRTGALSNPDFDGFYVYATWFLTGESRPFKSGNFDRLKPLSNFDKRGGWGAWEVALRYDKADFSETPVAARAGNEAESLTAGLNWYLNPNFKLQLNYIRFNGDNTPLDPVGAKTKGSAIATRVHLDW